MKNFIISYFQLVSSKKGKWIVLATWLVFLLLVNTFFPQANTQKNDLASNLSSNAPSQVAQSLLFNEFPKEQGTPALITWYRENGLSDKDLQMIQQLTAEITNNPLPNQEMVLPYHEMPLAALKQQLSEDGTTFVLPILFTDHVSTNSLKNNLSTLEKVTTNLFDFDPFHTNLTDSSTIHARTTGPVGISVDAVSLFSQGDLSLLIGTVIIVLICLLIIYRSPILALIPLLGVGFAYGIISPLLGALGKSGWIEFDSQSIAIMTVLLFGAGTDYCLFIISNYRSYLHLEANKEKALNKALKKASGAVAMSGLTVVFALIILLFSQYGAIYRFAIPFSLAIFIMMFASLTLVPAILAIFGRLSFFPFIPRTNEMKKELASKKGHIHNNPTITSKKSFGRKIGGFVVKKPWKVTIITTIILGSLALFSTKIVYTYDTLSSFPENMPSREGFDLIATHFTAGELAPVSVIVQSDGEKLDLKEAFASLDFISVVSDEIRGINDHNLIKYSVELNTNPYSNKAMDYLPILKKTIQKELEVKNVQHADEKVWLAGITATQYDTREVTKHDASVIIPIVIAVIAVLLFIYLRSITATLYLIVTVLLSYFSALGLGWIILHYGFGVEAIQGLIPLYSFVFIVALGEDYNIFMISGIWKKAKKMPLHQAIKEGVSESGGVITSAGIILAATFMVLTTLPMQILVHFGTITAIGVLLDTFVVRPFLVPSITALLGKKAFWPAAKQIGEHSNE